MRFDVSQPQLQTLLFSVLFLSALILSIRRSERSSLLPLSTTDEIKGLAILAVIFSHIGYFLSNNNQFLFPWSVLAGVAVNLFLFLSGFGLATSALKKPLPLTEYYKKRAIKLFIPLWIIITSFLIADYFLLQRSYPIDLTIANFFGLYPQADLWQSIDSPLWFITIIVFYYLLFPLLFWRSRPFLSAFLMSVAATIILRLKLPVTPDVLDLYKLHYLAFPIGVAFAGIFSNHHNFYHRLIDIFEQRLSFLVRSREVWRFLILTILLVVFAYLAIHSDVGQTQDIEQRTSLLTGGIIILIFLLKNIRFTLLKLFGVYSYEIYLFHWPLLSRYDFFYSHLPPFIATVLYLILFVILGYLLQKTTKFLIKKTESYRLKITG